MKKNIVPIIIVTLAIFSLTTSGIKTAGAVPPHYLGQSWMGGIIFWMQFPNGPIGSQYLIMTNTDLGLPGDWTTANGLVPATWHLPIPGELHKLCLFAGNPQYNQAASAYHVSTTASYWGSASNPTHAWRANFSTCNQAPNILKTAAGYARAVKLLTF